MERFGSECHALSVAMRNARSHAGILHRILRRPNSIEVQGSPPTGHARDVAELGNDEGQCLDRALSRARCGPNFRKQRQMIDDIPPDSSC